MVFLVLVVVGFVRGIEASLSASGDSDVVLIHSLGASENIENSSLAGRTASLLSASLGSIRSRYGDHYISPEVYMGAEIATDDDATTAMGLLRGVTPAAALVRRRFELIEGHWPGPNEVVVGRLAAAKLNRDADSLAIGRSVVFEGRSWRISGQFAASGSTFESEIWCPLEDLQQALKRQDLTIVALTVTGANGVGDVEEFCKERLDLELQATRETDYYASLQKHYGPVRQVAWLVVGLILGAGVFAGLNTMFGAVAGRVRELAMLQTLGFLRRAILLSLVQEAVLLSTAAALIAATFAVVVLDGMAVRFTMGAFTLRVDGGTLAIGMISGVLIGAIGAIPPAIRAMRLSVVDGLKAI